MINLDYHTNQYEPEVQIIIHLQELTNQLPDVFIDAKKVIKSFLPTETIPMQIDVPEKQLNNESKARMKQSKP